MAGRLMHETLTKLRFAAANAPLLPVLALLLVLAATAVHLLLLPARERAIADTEQRATTLEREARRATLERKSQANTPEDTREALLQPFPGEAQLNAQLGRLIELAGENGVQLPGGDYRLVRSKAGLFDRYVLNLPVTGGYRAIRAFVQAARTEFPALAVEDMAFSRESIDHADVAGQLRFVIYSRRNAP